MSDDVLESSNDERRVPRHVAVIMDGNGRWATVRHLPRVAGHRQGAETARSIVHWCLEAGVEVLTLFAFSSENWRRPEKEVSALMDLFLMVLRKEVKAFIEQGVQIRFLGDTSAFSPQLQELMANTEAMPIEPTVRLKLVIAVNYGGRWEIKEACQRLAEQVKAGTLAPEAITETLIAEKLPASVYGEPDLLIRTGGEQRLSNFLMWHTAYSELYFTESYWPEFSQEELLSAFASYAKRQRRFGRTGEQVTDNA